MTEAVAFVSFAPDFSFFKNFSNSLYHALGVDTRDTNRVMYVGLKSMSGMSLDSALLFHRYLTTQVKTCFSQLLVQHVRTSSTLLYTERIFEGNYL